MSFKMFMKSLRNGDSETLIKTMFLSLFVSFITFGVLYFLILQERAQFSSQKFFIFFSILSYALILPSVIYVRSFREFPCMTGMMIGMTMGMISGFLPGFYVGATNGMFYGSVFGMTVGILFGIGNGKCCGIMGMMEGIMAGFMGGIMGAMTSLMMLNDHLQQAGIIVFAISAVIMLGLNYLIFTESRQLEKRSTTNTFFTIVLSFLLTAVTIWFIVFGPRGGIFQ